MALTIGKRKRSHQAYVPFSEASSDNDDNHEDIFRKAFEAKFMPLEVAKQSPKAVQPVNQDDTASEEISDWDGFDSELNESEAIQVIDHSITAQSDALSRTEQRAYMVSMLLDQRVLHLTMTIATSTASHYKQSQTRKDIRCGR